LETGKEMIEYGEKHSNIRAQAMGHAVVGWAYLASGAFESAINSFYRVEQIAVDPFYATVWSCFRAFAHFFAGQLHEVEAALWRSEETLKAGQDYLEVYLKIGWGLLWVARGRIAKGITSFSSRYPQFCLSHRYLISLSTNFRYIAKRNQGEHGDAD
jgi:hypothetical protein